LTKQKSAAAPISAAEAVNARPYDIDKQTIEDLFEEARQWLADDTPIAESAEAEGLERMLEMARAAKSAADENRKVENKPFDDGKKEVQARYNALFGQADLIINGVLKRLTPWRNKLAEEQRLAAAAVAEEAERARKQAERTTIMAGSDLGAQHIAKEAGETAARLEKTAARLEKKAGTGLRMRTVWKFDFSDIKKAIAHYYREEPELMEKFIRERIAADSHLGRRNVPGVIYIEEKEAY
jgi:hypothetical protein